MATKRNSLRSRRIARSVPRQRGMPAAEREYQQVVREIEGSPLPDMNWSTQSPPPQVQRVRQTRYNQQGSVQAPLLREGLETLGRAVPQVRQAEAISGPASITGKLGKLLQGVTSQTKRKEIIEQFKRSQLADYNLAKFAGRQETMKDIATSRSRQFLQDLPPRQTTSVIQTGTATTKKADDFVPSAYKPDIKMGDKIVSGGQKGPDLITLEKQAFDKIPSPVVPGKTGRWTGRIPFLNRPWSSLTKKDKVKLGVIGGMGLYGGVGVVSGASSAFTPEVTKPTSPVNEDAYGAWLSDAGVQRNVPTKTPSTILNPDGTRTYPFGGYGTKEAQQQAFAMEQARMIDMLAQENKSLKGIKTPGLVAIPGGGGKMGYEMKIGERADGTDIIQYISGGGKHGAQKMADAKRIQKERKAENLAQKQKQIRMMKDPMYAYGLAMSGQAQIPTTAKKDKRMIIKFKAGKTADMPFNQAAFDFYRQKGIPVSAKNVRAPQSGVAGGGFEPSTVGGVPIQTRIPIDWQSIVPTGSGMASWTPSKLRAYYAGGSQRDQ